MTDTFSVTRPASAVGRVSLLMCTVQQSAVTLVGRFAFGAGTDIGVELVVSSAACEVLNITEPIYATIPMDRMGSAVATSLDNLDGGDM